MLIAMFDPWLEEAIFAGVAEEAGRQRELEDARFGGEDADQVGRLGEVPRRAARAYADVLTQKESRVPQSLGGVRGFKAAPLRFGAPTDVKPPSTLDGGADDPLHKTTLDATRSGLDALRFTIL